MCTYGEPCNCAENLRGDLVTILDSNGTAMVQYKYDARGKPIIKTGSMKDSLGTLKPYGYHGYVYDKETELFYLRSRFYNCNACRFLNSDTLLGNGKLISYNQFAYCRNAHVNRFDPDGYFGIGVALGVAGGLIALLWPSRGLAPEDEADIPPTSVEEHWGRNQYNQLPDESELLSIVGGTHPDWEEQDESANKYHRFTHGVQGAEAVYNKKYMSRDGKFEVIICYDAEYVPTPYIVTDPINAGTYNYYDYRDGLSGAWGHLQYDVIPYFLWRNSEDDSTSFFERIIGN